MTAATAGEEDPVRHNRSGAVDPDDRRCGPARRRSTARVRDEDQDPDFHWWADAAACGDCGRAWVAVVEIAGDLEEPVVPLECPGCGHRTGSPAGG